MTIAFVVLLLVAGLVLLAIELLVIPGFGLIGLLGVASTIAAGVVAFTQLGSAAGALALGGGAIASGLLFWLLPKTAAGKAMVLREAQQGRAADPGLAALVGVEGDTVTPLRPSGSARLGDRVVDVVADGIYVEAGTRVRVARVEGARVLVEPVPPSAS